MKQSTLPFAAGSETSLAAARSMVTQAGVDRERILDLFKVMGAEGATADEVELLLEMTHQSASARVSELLHKHVAIKDSGRRRLTRSGRQAVVYVHSTVVLASNQPE